jgi:hypothetical protein
VGKELARLFCLAGNSSFLFSAQTEQGWKSSFLPLCPSERSREMATGKSGNASVRVIALDIDREGNIVKRFPTMDREIQLDNTLIAALVLSSSRDPSRLSG